MTHPTPQKATSSLSIIYQEVTVWIFKQKAVQHTHLGLLLLCTTEQQFLLTPQCPCYIHSELSPKASKFLPGVHLVAVASVSH